MTTSHILSKLLNAAYRKVTQKSEIFTFHYSANVPLNYKWSNPVYVYAVKPCWFWSKFLRPARVSQWSWNVSNIRVVSNSPRKQQPINRQNTAARTELRTPLTSVPASRVRPSKPVVNITLTMIHMGGVRIFLFEEGDSRLMEKSLIFFFCNHTGF